ncbi:Oxygen regulatory protein NreC [Planctomycetaceae bacterium]|nr:Oxygen regulatory protein NreC [Planctomycetaceae bacterium]
MIHLILADDHVIVRQGFQQLLNQQPDFAVVGEAGDGATTLRLVEELHPDILVLDMVMPGLNGLEILGQVQRSSPQTRVIVLSMHDDRNYVLRALRGGAWGYLLKDSNTQDLVQAIRAAVNGQHYLSPPLVEHVILAYLREVTQATVAHQTSLSDRERDVLKLIGEGWTAGEIAQALALKKRTVETYQRRLRTKLGLSSPADLRRYALHYPS